MTKKYWITTPEAFERIRKTYTDHTVIVRPGDGLQFPEDGEFAKHASSFFYAENDEDALRQDRQKRKEAYEEMQKIVSGILQVDLLYVNTKTDLQDSINTWFRNAGSNKKFFDIKLFLDNGNYIQKLCAAILYEVV